MRILILKPSSLGDVVQALPVLRLLRRQFPEAGIYWWIDVDLSPLLVGDRDLTGLLLFHRRRWSSPLHWHEVVQHVLHLRELHFDWVIDLQALARSGLVAWLAGGALTVGLDDAREGATALYDLRVPRASYHTHAVDWYLDVLRALGVPVDADFEWLPERPSVAEAVRRKWPVGDHTWVAVQPGARWANKRWPVESYAEVVRKLSGDIPGARFVVLGGASDANLGAAIARTMPGKCLDLTGRTSLPEMVEWLRLSDALIINDSGPMHVAAALGKPVIAVFGPTEPRRTGPYGQIHHAIRHPLPCAPCLKSHCSRLSPLECLRAIPPEPVYEQARARLAEAACRGSRAGG